MEIIDGSESSSALIRELKPLVEQFKTDHHRSPGLEIIRISDDFGSVVYTERKQKVAKEAGFFVDLNILPKEVDLAAASEVIESANQNKSIDGVILQLPLPEHLPRDTLLALIAPNKDVDGLTRHNMGALMMGSPLFMPCTPQAILRLAQKVGVQLKGANVVILGQSIIVGRPVALACLNLGATVTVCHKSTNDLEAKVRMADILISAMGAPDVVDSKWIKPGSVVFDVSINRGDNGKIRGDIDHATCQHVGHITPVPGGVGPMTVACLLFNTMFAAALHANDKHLLETLPLINF